MNTSLKYHICVIVNQMCYNKTCNQTEYRKLLTSERVNFKTEAHLIKSLPHRRKCSCGQILTYFLKLKGDILPRCSLVLGAVVFRLLRAFDLSWVQSMSHKFSTMVDTNSLLQIVFQSPKQFILSLDIS